jgi:hypothetical protein
MMMSGEDGPHPILTLVGKICSSCRSSVSEILSILAERVDNTSAFQRHQRRIDARERATQIAYLKGLVTHAWNWVAAAFPSVPSSRVMSMGSQRRNSILEGPEDLQSGNADSDSTCVADTGNTSRLVHRHRTAKVADSDSWT